MGSHNCRPDLGNRAGGNSQGGVLAYGSGASTTTASVSGSVISGGSYGVVALTEGDGAVSRISVSRSTIHRTATAALNSQTANVGAAEVNVGGSLVVDSGNAWIQQDTGSAFLSLGDNQMSGNAGTVGTMTPLAPQ